MTLHVTALGDPRSLLPLIEGEVRGLDSTLPLFQIQTMEERVDDSLLHERLLATLSATLPLLGTLVAAIGLYGVLHFSVVQRTREIGIRMAIGAEPKRVLLMILRRAFVLVALGIGVGVSLAAGSLRVVAGLLYGVSPLDPATVAGATIFLSVVGLAAGLVPAINAARTDPWSALRQD